MPRLRDLVVLNVASGAFLLTGCMGEPRQVTVKDRHERVRAVFTRIDGERQGKAVIYDAAGLPHCVVDFRDDVKNGDELILDEHGDTIEGHRYRSGRKDGIQFQRSARGHFTRIENYRRGKPHGLMLLLHEDGSPRELSHYVDGVVDGPHFKWWQADTTGTFFMEGPLDKGQRTGTWRWHYQNGRLSREGHFVRDQPHGVWSEWDRRGRLISRKEFDHGQLIRDGSL